MTAILGAYSQSVKSAKTALDGMLEDRYLQGKVIMEDSKIGISFAAVNGEDRAIILKYNGCLLALFGSLFLPSGKRLTSEIQFSKEFIPAFTANSKRFLANCEGAFCFAFYDNTNERLFLATDAFGNLPLFYSVTEGFLFSTRQRPIASVIDSSISSGSVYEYIRLGLPLGHKSFYENINCLPVASVLIRDREGAVEVDNYFQPSYQYASQSEISSVVDSIEEVLINSIGNKLDSDTNSCIALSGGFDSRATLALIYGSQQTNKTLFYTHGPAGAYDMVIGRRIAKTLGIRHKEFVLSDEIFIDAVTSFDAIVSNSEGGLGIEAAISLQIWQWQREHCTLMFDSHGGQLYRRTIFKSRHKAFEGRTDIAEGILNYTTPPLFQSSFLSDELKKEADLLSLTSLREYFRMLPTHLASGDKIDRYFIEQLCQNKYSHVGNVQMNYLKFIHPLLTNTAAELLSQLPVDFRLKNGVYLHFIDTLAPQLTQIPVENNGYLVPFKGYRWKRYIPQVFDRVLRTVSIKSHLQHPITSIDMTMYYGKHKAESLLLENLVYIQNYVNISSLEVAIEKKRLSNTELTAFTNFSLLMKYLKES